MWGSDARRTKIITEFEVHELDDSSINHDMQYFVLYAMKEGENFNVDGMFGVWGADHALHIMNRFRQTGTLLKPRMGWLPPHPLRGEDFDRYYETLRPIAVYITKLAAAMCKVPSYREVRENDPRFDREDIPEWPRSAHPRELKPYIDKNFPEPSI